MAEYFVDEEWKCCKCTTDGYSFYIYLKGNVGQVEKLRVEMSAQHKGWEHKLLLVHHYVAKRFPA